MEPTFLAAAVIILLFSVIIHEVAHGFVALKFGDRTALLAGRLTLNPIPHIDPIGTILLPLLLILSGSPVMLGWAKPVPVNPFNFSNIRKGELFVSAAGIGTNFAIAVFAALILNILRPIFPPLLENILRFTILINLILAIFNSLPIPPLDGSKILATFLPPHLAQTYAQFERYGIFILLLLLLIPVGGSSLLGFFLGIILSFFQIILRL
ncbi:MAG: site-2 protease family protein [Candidatus Daviesbacteria bacterium]